MDNGSHWGDAVVLVFDVGVQGGVGQVGLAAAANEVSIDVIFFGTASSL